MSIRIRIIFLLLFTPTILLAQIPYSRQKDATDIFRQIFNIKKPRKTDSTSLKEGGKVIAILPTPGYAPQSRFLLQAVTNVAIQNTNANTSILNLLAVYTQNKQTIFQYTTSYFSKNNKYYFSTDWRFMNYPQATYGLGMNTSLNNPVDMDFRYLKLYETLMRNIGRNLYIGIGYQFDYHWKIQSMVDGRTVEHISDYSLGVAGKSISSGPTLALLFDSRTNSLSATQGFYANIVFKQSLKTLGSNTNYQSLLIDVRKYFDLSKNTNHILAFWFYNFFTHGTVPYLDMPSTGWDTNVNTGRGFIQGRFRGKNLMYFETEYRFALTRNQLLGGVLFSNLQTVTEIANNRFQKVIPAVGAGLRIRVNKFSRANLAIDYGIGGDGSRNIYFNFGEVF
ncbi:BamA/TamA family outer membrane protein [Emticicia sp. BO119]|uniref:BamA/TamA family outer membrane protein n=1 Tax=Emticicia sp. BO119 TaxID=2757768 RepID=UPI0015EFFA18|nr:BamA/TamA family outer membrane protein [Emticicia sp. BO119]MBA4853784.1 BamA/TamA family outer membrane protein [Emticicia sp. BO119]